MSSTDVVRRVCVVCVVAMVLGGCDEGGSGSAIDVGQSVTDAADAGETGDVRGDGADGVEADGSDGGMCLDRPEIIECEDRVESEVAARWSAAPTSPNVDFRQVGGAIFGSRGARLRADGRDSAALVWRPESPIDVTTGAEEPPVVRVALRGENPYGYGWRGETPKVTVRDAEERSVQLAPAEGNAELIPAEGDSWRWLKVPLAHRDGWRATGQGNSSLEALDLSAVAEVEFAFRSWGPAFTVDVDGLAFTGPDEQCDYACPENCNGRGECAPESLRCHCQMGAVGPSCGQCGEGFVEADDGSCQLAEDGDYTEWPNEVSDTTGDAWLRAHHQEVEVLRPRVLVLNFANQSSMGDVEGLTDDIVGGFETASRPAEEGDDAPAQLQYEIAKVVDMRNGREGNPPEPSDWSRDNSTLFPRVETPSGGLRFDYAEMFTDEFAEHYGYEDPDASGEYLSLCELVERGKIHDVWMVAAHADDDAVPAEVLEYKQRYTARDNPIPGSFSPCAGNGCFRRDVSPCSRSVRIGFINYKRGPGCYLHNIGHLMEWNNSHRVVPGFSRWFDRFAGMDLDERYNLPIESLYAVNCEEPPCITFPEASTIEITHRGETHRIDNWNQVCGNTHFPPNGAEHYNYDNETSVRTTCEGFGRREVSCGEDAAGEVAQGEWESLRSEVPDCGGGFLSWWYRRMPAGGTSHRYSSGEPMKSVWPYLFY